SGRSLPAFGGLARLLGLFLRLLQLGLELAHVALELTDLRLGHETQALGHFLHGLIERLLRLPASLKGLHHGLAHARVLHELRDSRVLQELHALLGNQLLEIHRAPAPEDAEVQRTRRRVKIRKPVMWVAGRGAPWTSMRAGPTS